ncbi:MAG: hypothetical protein Q7J57_18060 [Gemmobacter sp.]|nr:hypothetical protein [Gemmobacter sp.]
MHASAGLPAIGSDDARLRVAMRTDEKAWADRLLEEVQALWLGGPAGAGGCRGRITPRVISQPTFIDRGLVKLWVRYLQS